jgi:hypothetical protein
MDKNKWNKDLNKLEKNQKVINEMIKDRFGETWTYEQLGELLTETLDLLHNEEINKIKNK